MKAQKRLLTSFRELKDILEKNYLFPDNECITSKKNPFKEKTDEEIFIEAMSDVKEIKEFRKIPVRGPQRLKRNIHRTTEEKDDSLDVLKDVVKGKGKIRLSDTGEYIEWARSSVRKDLLEKLHQGHFSVQDYIDLHGMTLREAEYAFTSFFKEALKRGLFCIKVIHGRGLRSPEGPVLKEALKRWLNRKFRKWVLAYSTAQDRDGGLGATYILLSGNKGRH